MELKRLNPALLAALCSCLVPSVMAAETDMKPSANVTMFGADTAFTPPGGDAFVGLTWADVNAQGGSADNVDGDLAFGAGFGNPVDGIGVLASVNVTSLTTDFGDAGSVSLKASRALLLQPNAVVFGALSAQNVAPWGEAKANDTSWSVMVSGLTQIEGARLIHPVMWTAGYGSDAVRRSAQTAGTEGGLFAGVGVGVTEYLGLSAAATQNQVNVGLGLSLPALKGVSFSYGINDVTDNVGSRQQTLSVSYSLTDLF